MKLVDPTKITASQINKGSQYLRKAFIQTSDVKTERSAQETPNI
jgi:hypothetical protein